MSVTRKPFGKNYFGEDVELFTLTNANGLIIKIMNHGGTIMSLETPDRDGKLADIVLGHDTAEEYGPRTPYFGSVIGRYANRIKNGRFVLNGKPYQLFLNNGPNSLHGGQRGFDKVVWNAEPQPETNAVKMTYLSKDGEENYPGNLHVTLTYTLTDNNEIKIDYTAKTDKATPINLTNHTYFNLAGHDAGYIGAHILMINANYFLPTDKTAIPCGELKPVAGTPFDFTSPVPVGERIDADDEQLNQAGGYDHTFCLNKNSESELSLAARAFEPSTGRMMEVFTTEPGIQFYTGTFLDGTLKGKNGHMYEWRGGFCLETQHYPDSPNQPQFPNTILQPGETFVSQTIYRFSTKPRGIFI